jgi:hypothetical protein
MQLPHTGSLHSSCRKKGLARVHVHAALPPLRLRGHEATGRTFHLSLSFALPRAAYLARTTAHRPAHFLTRKSRAPRKRYTCTTICIGDGSMCKGWQTRYPLGVLEGIAQLQASFFNHRLVAPRFQDHRNEIILAKLRQFLGIVNNGWEVRIAHPDLSSK